MKAIHLKVDYLNQPIGIDLSIPHFFWNCQKGITQTAYRIYVRNEEGEELWDTGKVSSQKMTHILYEGKNLDSRNCVFWKVKLWDEKDQEGEWSEEACFEMGLLHPTDWKAKWISGNYKVNKKQRYPIDCFLKEMNIEKEVKKARLYITACGLYEAQIDQNKIGTFCLAPGITDYRKRVQYQTYDVTQQLKVGRHELTVQLADGWYRGSVGAWGLKNQYGIETKLLAQLEITYEDGSCQQISTDESWKWSNDGPLRFADNKDGEIIEAYRIPSYAHHAKVTSHIVVPTASNNVGITEQERLSPVMIKTPSGKTLLDFKQNIAGYIEFHVQAQKGQRIFLRFGEMLDENGEFTQKNIQCSNKKITTPLQQIEYICKEGDNHYKTTFAVFGFQYVLIETDVKYQPEDITAIVVASDLERSGYFESSNEYLNRFVEATMWSAKDNFLDIPTDCPTRERHGWSGDAQIFFETAAYLFDCPTFFKKYLNDMYDWQKPNGKLPQIAPAGGVDFYMNVMNGSVGWADAGILIPYRFWKHYGDADILKEYYEKMKAYAEFMLSRCGKWGGPYAKPLGLKGDLKKYAVNCGQSYGEWAEPTEVHVMKWIDFAEPHPEVSTAYTAYVLSLMSEIAQELGHQKDADDFKFYSHKVKESYQALVKTKKFSLDTDRQAQLVRPLAFDLLNEEQKKFAQDRLIQALNNYGWRLGTGFLSTPLILDVLAEYDLDAAYRLLENEEMPGWLFMSKNNATTIWESWEGTMAQGGIASLNHYSKGAVCEWLFKTMCGIRQDGENHFILAPCPGGNFTYAKASYHSIYGTVESGWKKENENWIFSFTIPSNCTANIKIQGESKHVNAGTYRFEVKVEDKK